MWFAVKGLAIGFLIAAPVGPIGVLCIRRTLVDGRRIGFLSGLGAATADMLYGAVAAFGLTAIQHVLIAEQFLAALDRGLVSYLPGSAGPGKPGGRQTRGGYHPSRTTARLVSVSLDAWADAH